MMLSGNTQELKSLIETNFNYKMYCQIDQILHKGLLAQEKALQVQ